MKVLTSWLERQIALCLVLLLVVPIGAAATTPLQPTIRVVARAVAAQPRLQTAGQGTNNTVAEASALNSYPDSPDMMWAQTVYQSQQTTAPQSSQQSTQPQQEPPAPASAPVGTAAAPYEKPGGVPASRPAGAVIAPSKQRRTRSFAIRAALIVGAGVAIGVVTAASLGSSSRPH